MTINSEPTTKRLSIPFYLLLTVLLFAFVQTFSTLSPIYLSFLLTLIISLALNPLVNRLRVLTGGRKGATSLVVLVMVVVLVFTGWSFFRPLKNSITNLSEALPGYWERLQKPLIKMEQRAKQSEMRLQVEVNSEIANDKFESKGANGTENSDENAVFDEGSQSISSPGESSIRSSLAQMLRGVVGSFTKVAFNGAQVLVVLVTVFFAVIFMLLSPRPIVSAIFSIVPERHHKVALIIIHRICRFAPAWGGSTLAGMLTIGLLVFLLMWPLLGLTDALVLGLIAGLLEAVPFLGPTLSTIPAVLLALGKGGMTPVWVLLAYIGVQAVENNIVLPLIMAKGMKVHAVAVIFSMLFCVAAFGVLGVLIAAPLVAILTILHEELFRKKFLPSVSDADLDGMARKVLHETSLAIE